MEIGDTVCRLLRIFGKGENGVAGSSRWARLEPSELVGLEVDSGIQVSVSILSGINSH